VPTQLLAVELGLAALGFGWIALGLPDRGGPRPWWFMAGIAVVAVALVSPVHGWSERSLTGHMVQHVLLISLAAPLLARARPFATVAERFGLVDRVMPRPGWLRSRPDTFLAVAGVVQVGVLLGWHAPVLFDDAVGHPLVHELEHATLLASAFVLWSLLLRVADDGAAVVTLFVVTLPAMAYGVALTLASHTWYAPYPRLRDQQLAGVVMWAYGGLLAVVGGVVLGVEWLRRAERTDPGWRRAIGGAR
jgi:putative membrane protein